MGDRALCQVADWLSRAMRRTDMVARYGGEEFVILMPGTSPEAALLRMETLRREIAATPIELGDGQTLRVNFSAGIAGNAGRCGGDDSQGAADLRRRAAARRQAGGPRAGARPGGGRGGVSAGAASMTAEWGTRQL